MENQESDLDFDDEREQLQNISSISQVEIEEDSSFSIPSDLRQKLYPHQVEGVKWLWKMHKNDYGGALLADDMGLGKTVQVCVYLQCIQNMNLLNSCLIICPASVLHVWESTLKNWTELPVIAFHGSSKISERKLRNMIRDSFSIVLSTYGMLQRHVNFFKTLLGLSNENPEDNIIPWDYIILDEGHKIRNKDTSISQSMKLLHSKHRIVLSGTPIQNHLIEMWNIMDWLSDHRLLGDIKSFNQTFRKPIEEGQNRSASPEARRIAAECAECLRQLIFSITLRREKTTTFNSPMQPTISKKTEIVLWCRLNQRQIQAYQVYIESDPVKKVMRTSRNPLESLATLQKLCNHMLLLNSRDRRLMKESEEYLLFEKNPLDEEGNEEEETEEAGKHEDDPVVQQLRYSLREQKRQLFSGMSTEEKEDSALVRVDKRKGQKAISLVKLQQTLHEIPEEILYTMGNKMNVIIPLTVELIKENHKVLIFSKSLRMLYIIDECLSRRNINTLHFDGSIHTSDRMDILEQFKSKNIPVLLITIGAGGEGITVIEADRILIVDPNWNPSVDDQAIDRAYRIGQTKNVIVYRFITCGSIEEKMYARQVWKECVNKLVMENRNTLKHFNKSELKDLFILQDPAHSTMRKNIAELQLQVNLPDDPDHMEFLSTLDIDGISEHTQLFSLSHEQVNMVVKDTITNTVKQLKAKYKMNKTTVDNQQQPGEITSLPPAEGGGKRWRISGEQTEIASKRPHFLYSNNPSYFHPPQPFSTVLNTVLSNPSLPDDDDDDDELSKSRSIIDLVSSSSDDDAELIEDWDAYEDYQRDNDIINESSQSTEMEEESQSVSDSTTPSPVSSKPPVSTLLTTHPVTPVISTIPSSHPAMPPSSHPISTLPATPPISNIPSTLPTTPPISTIPSIPPISTHPTINNADTPDYLSSDSESDVFEIPEPKKKQSLPVFNTVKSPPKSRLNTITPKPTIPVDTTIMDLDSSSQSDDDSVETVESTTNP